MTTVPLRKFSKHCTLAGWVLGMRTAVTAAAGAVVLASTLASAQTQTVAADRVRLNTAPCTIDSVNGTPDKLRLADCSTITTATATNLTLGPTGDLVLGPAGLDVLPSTAYTVNLGMLSNKYLTLHAAELWVETLVAQNTLATIGGRVLVGPTTSLTQDVGTGDGWIEVKHNQWQADDFVFVEANGAYEHMKVSYAAVVASGTGPDYIEIPYNWAAQFGSGVQFRITTGACVGTWTSTGATYDGGSNRTRITVSSAPPACTSGALTWRTDPSDGNYRYWVVRNQDGSGANAWYAGDAVFSTGAVGGGYIDLYSVAGVLAGAGPTIVGNVRTGAASYNQVAARWAIGNLNGLYGYGAEVYGAAFGDASATNVTVDATNGFRIRSGTTNKLAADTSGNLALTGALSIGTSGSFASGATGYSTGTGWWMDYNAGTPRFRIGNPAGNQLTWDGTTLSIVGNGSGLTAITGGNITTGTVTATQIAANTITGSQIASNAIDTDELNASAVTAAKIATGTITATQIAAGTITADKMNVSSLSAVAANLGSVTSGSISISTGGSNGLFFNVGGSGDFVAGNFSGGSGTKIEAGGNFTTYGTSAFYGSLTGVYSTSFYVGGTATINGLGGSGDRYVCVNNNGDLFASATTCN